MKKQLNQYQRLLSDDEVGQERIMVTKDALKFFPKPFKKFSLHIGEQTMDASVEAIDCKCMGPANPHEHYWLPIKNHDQAQPRLKHGMRVIITKNNDQTYTLTAG